MSVFDHGFLYGDSVYETLRTYGNRPFLLWEHLERLQQSGAALMLPRNYSDEEVATQIDRVLEAAALKESVIRILWTRGRGDITYDLDPRQHSTVVVIAQPFVEAPAEHFARGISVALVDIRRNPVTSLDPRVKTSNLLNPRLAYLQATRSGAMEAVMMNHDGFLSEGSRTNLFVVQGGQVRTPTVETGILNGITRRLVLQLCREAGIPCQEARLLPQDLVGADEAFMTSTTKAILPLASVDGKPIGKEANWPVMRRLMQAYEAFVARGDWHLADGPGSLSGNRPLSGRPT